jgi:transcriptional regulator with XRE-family HTH domain
MANGLTIGERVAWYRRRRGMSQTVLAGTVNRTEDWVSKVENNRIDLDRLSIIRALADALDVSLGDLLAEPSLMDWTSDSGTTTIPALRSALMNYQQLTPMLGQDEETNDPESVVELRRQVTDVWDAYQASRFGYVTHALPFLLREAYRASNSRDDVVRAEALSLLALTYQAAATTLTKVGETDLAWMAADRGLMAARDGGDPVVLGSLFRAVAHALLSNGRYEDAVSLVASAGDLLTGVLDDRNEQALSVYGSLFLAGSMAAARADDRATTQAFLHEADRSARRLGRDANHLWTAFGPTNVAIHRVSTAMELGDVQVAVDLGPRVDASSMPVERRVRHALEVARAYNSWNRTDDAMHTLLHVEQAAPEQVRYHFISRQLVLTWMRRTRGKPSYHLAGLAHRLKVA